jgi:hypothetical protein
MDEMQTKAAIRQLLVLHQKIDDWDMNTPAGTNAEKALKARLSAKEDRILEEADSLIVHFVRLIGRDIDAQALALDRLSVEISVTSPSIAKVEAVIAIADEVIALASQLAAIARS